MAREMRKRIASKATKKAKTSSKKRTKAKTRRKAVASKKSKSALRKARDKRPPPKASESFSQRVAAAFHTIVDTLSDAEQLHRKLDPGVSREPE
jgi:hypothetical protein